MSDFDIIRRRLGERLSPLRNLPIEPDRIPQAAVTLILREAAGAAQLLIIKRAERPGDHWSGHLALPGGRAQIEDDGLIVTATRETYEEVGINLFDGGEFIGQLELLVPTNPILPPLEIAPFVAVAPPEFTVRLSEEVAHAFWIAVADLKREGRSAVYSMRFGEVVKKWPAYPTEAGPIWGITERILTNFLSLLD
jgi:8-oxo-dGTP pyrophosphatase MutT (NUDIX family)